jgi:hypothetical protein
MTMNSRSLIRCRVQYTYLPADLHNFEEQPQNKQNPRTPRPASMTK